MRQQTNSTIGHKSKASQVKKIPFTWVGKDELVNVLVDVFTDERVCVMFGCLCVNGWVGAWLGG